MNFDPKSFKIRASAVSKIMGQIGLTEKQEQTLADLKAKEKLTAKQAETLADLEQKSKSVELPQGAQTYLKEWYAETLFGDREEIKSKYLDKGNAMESMAIDICALELGYGILDKNDESRESEFITGTCDVLIPKKEVLDTKCSWGSKTFIESALSPLCADYYWQMIAYCGLYEVPKARVCFCLMDTPAEINFGNAVSYSHIPQKNRIHTKEVIFDAEQYAEIGKRVELCRAWLAEYHNRVMGALNA